MVGSGGSLTKWNDAYLSSPKRREEVAMMLGRVRSPPVNIVALMMLLNM